ncbi:MAG: hypothetical protein Q8S58_18870, partial [Bosea sp. (in: a-proteobacteria)]|nr:hypothetical protein [Bosea sp. (in: a-proteobacteria)]
MTLTLHLQQALLPEGFAENVRLTHSEGIITAVELGIAAQSGDIRLSGLALPGMPNLHSHAFQRGMAGLSERRGASEDSFWTWREVMYRFLDRLDPDDVQALAAQAFVEMLEIGADLARAFARQGEIVKQQPAAAVKGILPSGGVRAIFAGVEQQVERHVDRCQQFAGAMAGGQAQPDRPVALEFRARIEFGKAFAEPQR